MVKGFQSLVNLYQKHPNLLRGAGLVGTGLLGVAAEQKLYGGKLRKALMRRRKQEPMIEIEPLAAPLATKAADSKACKIILCDKKKTCKVIKLTDEETSITTMTNEKFSRTQCSPSEITISTLASLMTKIVNVFRAFGKMHGDFDSFSCLLQHRESVRNKGNEFEMHIDYENDECTITIDGFDKKDPDTSFRIRKQNDTFLEISKKTKNSAPSYKQVDDANTTAPNIQKVIMIESKNILEGKISGKNEKKYIEDVEVQFGIVVN